MESVSIIVGGDCIVGWEGGGWEAGGGVIWRRWRRWRRDGGGHLKGARSLPDRHKIAPAGGGGWGGEGGGGGGVEG